MRTANKKKSSNKSTGAAGEEIAAQYLLNRGDEILARNWRIREGELDLISLDRSGSLRTARDAAELLRPVMAIPGPITSPVSEGCHRLIGERAAEM